MPVCIESFLDLVSDLRYEIRYISGLSFRI